MCDPGSGHRRGTLREIIDNWREHEGAFTHRLHLTMRNTWIKIRTRSDCCGNFGEPGC